MTKVDCPIEDVECKIFHAWLQVHGIPHTHIPNESRSSKRDAYVRGKQLKAMGVSAGYWDYDVFVPAKDINNNVGAYELIKIEMKRAQKSLSRVSEEQKAWGKIFEKAGIECHICYGAEEAIRIIKEAYERINDKKMREKTIDF